MKICSKSQKFADLSKYAIKNRFCKLIVTGEKKLGLMDGEKLSKILQIHSIDLRYQCLCQLGLE